MATTKARKKPAEKPPGKSWEWKEGFRPSIPAPVAGAEIERIARSSGTEVSHVTPDSIVDAAESPDSPLHPCFEWRDDVAARMARKQQARMLIRNLIPIVIIAGPPLPPINAAVTFAKPEAPRPSIGFVSVKLPDREGNCYVATEEAMTKPDLRAQVIRDAIIYLKGAQKRYGHLTELREVYDAIDKAARKFDIDVPPDRPQPRP